MGASIHIQILEEDTREERDRLMALSDIVPLHEEPEGLHWSYGSVYSVLHSLGLPREDEYCGTIDPKLVVERAGGAAQWEGENINTRLFWLFALAVAAIKENRQLVWG